MRKLALIAALVLTGCHLDFNQQIECPTYSATGVAVYKFDVDTYLVIYPPADPRTRDLVNDSGCKVSAAPWVPQSSSKPKP